MRIEALLGVSKQRAHQLADEGRLPVPVGATVAGGCGIGRRFGGGSTRMEGVAALAGLEPGVVTPPLPVGLHAASCGR
jgi:hypothetical protein